MRGKLVPRSLRTRNGDLGLAPAGRPEKLLEVENLRLDLSVERGYRAVLQDVSFDLAPGEALGLVGESGSGKSMTAKAINRLLPRGARAYGTVTFNGHAALTLQGSALRTFRREVAMIFQDPRAHVNPVRSVGDYMTEALRTNDRIRTAEAQRQATTMLGRVGITRPAQRMRQYPHELSGGMLQRVVIAAALLTKPKLLLADEPTTALDVTIQAEVVALINQMREELDVGLIFITHDLELASAICNRTAVIYAGRVVEVRDSAQLHSDPLHPYTAALMRARPRVDTASPRLTAIPGRPMPAYEAPLAACAFAERCEHQRELCVSAEPPLIQLDGGLSRCARAEQLRGRMAADD